jgi:cell division protein FtsQ
VRRLWPDQLIIHLQEQQVVARWGKKGLLNAQHQVFYPASDSDLSHFDQLPHLFGSAGSEDDMMTALELVDHQLRPIDLKVKELVLAKRRAWHLLLTNGIEVKVGRELNVTKLKRFVRFYQGYLAKSRRSAAVIDLRYPHGLAIAWQTNHSKT